MLQNEKHRVDLTKHSIDHTTTTPNETANTLFLYTALKMKNGADTKILISTSTWARESLKFITYHTNLVKIETNFHCRVTYPVQNEVKRIIPLLETEVVRPGGSQLVTSVVRPITLYM